MVPSLLKTRGLISTSPSSPHLVQSLLKGPGTGHIYLNIAGAGDASRHSGGLKGMLVGQSGNDKRSLIQSRSKHRIGGTCEIIIRQVGVSRPEARLWLSGAWMRVSEM